MIDLHCHSTASDGLLPPSEVVRFAAAQNLNAIALTDHDTTAGLAEARAIGAEVGVEVIGGCEFSVAADWGEMHLLGYFIPDGDPMVADFLTRARADRWRRARTMVSRLVGLGLAIQWSDVEKEADGAALGRPHVARAMVHLGLVDSAQAAFDKYLRPGRPAYVEKTLPTLRDVANLVHSRGGIVSAAHLRDRGTESLLRRLKDEGLDAVEVRHPSHRPEVVAQLEHIASQLDLGKTGGSDWHGESDPANSHALLGVMEVPDSWLVELKGRRSENI